MLNSNYRPLCAVALPFAGRQHYMHTFDLARPAMAPGFEDYLAPVLALCRSAGAVAGLAHMTVDEKVVQAGRSQRRPRPHVDGVFMPDRPNPRRGGLLGDWGGGGGGWLHTCNDLQGAGGPVRRMPVIVAASAPGCRAYRGRFDAVPADDGDLSRYEFGAGEVLPAGIGYLLSPDCVHESMLMERDTPRTFLRIALPVDFEFVP